MAVAIPIIVILVIAVVTTIVLAANRQRGEHRLLSRETKQRDSSTTPKPIRGLLLDGARDQPAANAPTTRAPRTRPRPRPASAATSRCGNP